MAQQAGMPHSPGGKSNYRFAYFFIRMEENKKIKF